MIKFGIRRNMLYPGLFILFTCIRRIDKYFLEKYFLGNVKITFTQISVMILSSFIISSVFFINYKKNKNNNKKKEIIVTRKIKLIQTKAQYEIPDKQYKIFILIFFAAYFEFFGFLSRRFISMYDLNDDNYDEFNAKFRGLEILSSSLLCHFTLRIEIYKHHIFSLIIIAFCLLINLVLEYNKNENTLLEYLIKIINVLGSSLSRAFLDAIEKYLFEADYINVFGLIFIEEFFNLIFGSFFYFFQKPRKQVKDLIHNSKNTIGSIILLIIYGILTGFKNIYRRFTVKQYTPMSRAFAESVIDPLLIIFEILDLGAEVNNKWSFIGTFISTFVIIFGSCVYNEVIILYCCNMEYYTYSEIAKRARTCSDFKIRNSSAKEDHLVSESEFKVINYNENEN